MKYTIIIPTYNHCDDLLIPCIESILKYTIMSDVELIISANGCVDNTLEYLTKLQSKFDELGFSNHFKYIWNDRPIGYAKANNEAIKISKGEKIILLNNDIILLDQPRNLWVELLEHPFNMDNKCGISGPIKQYSPEAGRDFCVFFCVMIDKIVFDSIGLLNEEYGIGSGEDAEFCIEAENHGFTVRECVEKQILNDSMYCGYFPIYHKGEQTVHDESLVSNYHDIYYMNGLKLAKKYNIEYYRTLLNNNYERHLSVNGEDIPPREKLRYLWAASNIVGNTVLEVGCSNGYGSQFFRDDIEYTGIDYDRFVIEESFFEHWPGNKKFIHADINTFDLGFYDTIVAMEIIEHLDNGLDIVEKLKSKCKRLLITVPYMEPKGFWGEHHKLHGLNESHFPDFTFKYCDENGNLHDSPIGKFNIMMGVYDKR